MRDSELIELKPKRLEYWWEGEREGRERERVPESSFSEGGGMMAKM